MKNENSLTVRTIAWSDKTTISIRELRNGRYVNSVIVHKGRGAMVSKSARIAGRRVTVFVHVEPRELASDAYAIADAMLCVEKEPGETTHSLLQAAIDLLDAHGFTGAGLRIRACLGSDSECPNIKEKVNRAATGAVPTQSIASI